MLDVVVLRKVESSFRVLEDLDGALGALLLAELGLGVLLAAEVLKEEAACGRRVSGARSRA
jgi:hypothetical protein